MEKRSINNLSSDFANVCRGIVMGAADIIPGVSGGTMAIILGIYERLVSAISRVDTQLIGHVFHRRIGEAASRIDLRFLMSLGSGILIGVVALGSLMEQLLGSADSRSRTLAVFFGLIIASTLVVGRRISWSQPGRRFQMIVLAVISALFAFWLTGLQGIQGSTHPGYVFLCGMIGICAMILPGISGAYLLVLLGLYEHITGILHHLRSGMLSGDDIKTVIIFAGGCAVGIILFSKFLRWLLANWHDQTIAVLCGFMVGALRKIWPFQSDLTPGITELKHKVYQPIMPERLSAQVITCLGIGLAAMIVVLLIERVSRSADN